LNYQQNSYDFPSPVMTKFPSAKFPDLHRVRIATKIQKIVAVVASYAEISPKFVDSFLSHPVYSQIDKGRKITSLAEVNGCLLFYSCNSQKID